MAGTKHKYRRVNLVRQVPPPDEAGPSTSRAATFGLPDVAAVNPIHRDPAKGKGPANPLPSNPQVEKGKAKMLSPIPEELHSAFPPKTEEEVENDWLTERANNKPGRPPLQVDPRLRRGWDPNYENFDDWFSVWPEPESLYGEDYADLHYAMCKWLRDWEFDKFDIEYQPPPLLVEIADLRRFALVWMPWFMVTGLGLTPFEGPVRRGKMSFLRCLIDGVPWDVFPPGVGMSWWSAEQISRSLDLARTKFTASQGAAPSGAPPPVFAAEPKPASTVAPAVGKTPSAGAGPSGAPPPVFAAEPKPASTVAPAVAKTPSAGAGPSGAPPPVFAAEPKPASTVAPAVAKTPSAGAAPSGAPPPVFAADPKPASTVAPAVAKTPSAGAGPSGAPPPVFAAEPKPASTVAPAVAKTPSAGAGPSGAPPPVFAADPKPASTVAPAVAKTPSAGAGPSGAPPPVFAAEPKPASTVAPAVAKTPSAEAAPSDAPRRPKQSKTAEMLAKLTQQKVCT
eukprot:jgi/Tetstr1/444421/TSEL_032309.t1